MSVRGDAMMEVRLFMWCWMVSGSSTLVVKGARVKCMDGEEEKTGTTEEDLSVDHQMPRHVEARQRPPDLCLLIFSHQTSDGYSAPTTSSHLS